MKSVLWQFALFSRKLFCCRGLISDEAGGGGGGITHSRIRRSQSFEVVNLLIWFKYDMVISDKELCFVFNLCDAVCLVCNIWK